MKKKRRTWFLCIVLLVHVSSLTACTIDRHWSFSKEEKAFSGQTSKIQVKEGEKIVLSEGEKGIRLYYDVTNFNDERENAYELLLKEISGLYQKDNELEIATLGDKKQDAPLPLVVDVESTKTAEVYLDYRLLDDESDIEMRFTEDTGEDTRATLTFRLTDFAEKREK